jgi:hypothetical protein
MLGELWWFWILLLVFIGYLVFRYAYLVIVGSQGDRDHVAGNSEFLKAEQD